MFDLNYSHITFIPMEPEKKIDTREPDIDAIAEARYEMKMGGIKSDEQFKKEEQDDYDPSMSDLLEQGIY